MDLLGHVMAALLVSILPLLRLKGHIVMVVGSAQLLSSIFVFLGAFHFRALCIFSSVIIRRTMFLSTSVKLRDVDLATYRGVTFYIGWVQVLMVIIHVLEWSVLKLLNGDLLS